jgi:hypothetical protein
VAAQKLGDPPASKPVLAPMHNPDESAYHDEGAWVIDDWR